MSEHKNNANGFDYSIIYKYNVLATKELITKYEDLELKYNTQVDRLNRGGIPL